MIRFQADADIDPRIILTLRRLEPAVDFASANESQLHGIPDPQILEFAHHENRILVTCDRNTMIDHFRVRLAEGKSSPGLIIASQFSSFASIAEALLIIWSASSPEEWKNQARHLPSFSLHFFPR